MRLTRIDDPRDNLERADRDQLYRFAREKGIKEIDDRMYMGGNAASLMRMILRQKGITDISVPYHQLGMPTTMIQEEPSGKPPVMIEDMLLEQLKEAQSAPRVPDPIPVSKMSIGELRQTCKARGIKLARTDNMITMREKLGG